MLKSGIVVEISVERWSEARSWYTDNLGLTEGYVDEANEWVELAIGEGPAVLTLRGTRSNTGASKSIVPMFETSDLDGVREQLKGRGVDITREEGEGQRETGLGYRWLNLEDPEGHKIRIYEWLGDDT